ncbi:hypothetical protein DM992_32480 [Burkholderia sp. JP2-270]|nr:hypothetical protein DM992_32480 [Burkholderia sp. JP2-270]
MNDNGFPPGAVLVFGGSGGIGQGVALEFARAGVPVAVGYPSDEAALKLIWLALRNVAAKWTGSRHDWKSAMTQFALLYPDRFNIGI